MESNKNKLNKKSNMLIFASLTIVFLITSCSLFGVIGSRLTEITADINAAATSDVAMFFVAVISLVLFAIFGIFTGSYIHHYVQDKKANAPVEQHTETIEEQYQEEIYPQEEMAYDEYGNPIYMYADEQNVIYDENNANYLENNYDITNHQTSLGEQRTVLRTYLKPGQVLPKGYRFDEVLGRLVKMDNYDEIIRNNVISITTAPASIDHVVSHQNVEVAKIQPETQVTTVSQATPYAPLTEEFTTTTTTYTEEMVDANNQEENNN